LVENSGAAERSWQQGQDAMRRGAPNEAIGHYQQSLKDDPAFTRSYLSLAAAHLEAGDEAASCTNLACYVSAHPEQLALRVQLAELLLRLQRPEEARAEFERLSDDAQQLGEEEAANVIHCQRRLMEIAEAAADDYGEHLHRGIGLYLLARQRADLPDPDDQLPVEGLLCRAAAELAIAHRERPERARPSWYLYVVWSRLAQQQPALRSLQAADAAILSLDLTPAEQQSLELARQQYLAQSRKKS
jgi:hypothetical protein